MGALFPNVLAYAQRIQARPAWQAAAAKTEPYSFTLKR
jgi:glutathione S-transferase